MPVKYTIPWLGLDRGHEGLWAGPIWLPAFIILARYNGAKYADPDSPIYDELELNIPSVTWRSPDPSSPTKRRTNFRDAQEPWASTGVVVFNDDQGTISLTKLGERLAAGEISPEEVFIRAMENHEQDGERPFCILATAFLHHSLSRSLSLDQLINGVMQNFRPGVDDLSVAIASTSAHNLGENDVRRFKHILKLLESVGAISSKTSNWIGWNRNILQRLSDKINSHQSAPKDLSLFVDSLYGNLQKTEVGVRAKRSLLLRASCCLLSKRFLIATGLAGSGKTKLAQALARWLAPDDCYRVVAVGADWTGNENILGYPDGLDKEIYISRPALELIIHAKANPESPHFLILDEMNLSHVERYFADLLSAIESDEEIQLYSGPPRNSLNKEIPNSIKLPKNLLIIGTVNVDETTYMFSPKVLDRANVIEFRMEQDEIKGFLANPFKPDLSKLDGQGIGFAKAFVDATQVATEIPEGIRQIYEAEMVLLFKILQDYSAEFGYRTAHETSRYLYFYRLLCNYPESDVEWFSEAFDGIVLQKLLPKLHGSRSKLAPLLKDLWHFCVVGPKDRGADINMVAQARADSSSRSLEPAVDVPKNSPYPMSAAKIARMWRLLKDNGFASFSEA